MRMQLAQAMQGRDALVNPTPVHFLQPLHFPQVFLLQPMRVGILRGFQPTNFLRIYFQYFLLNIFDTFVLRMLIRELDDTLTICT